VECGHKLRATSNEATDTDSAYNIGGVLEWVDPAELPTSTFTDPVMREAEANYQFYCAHCHSYNGEGQALCAPGETARVGLKMVSPHDSSGNLWRYADPVLIEVIKQGIQNPLTLPDGRV